MLTFLYQIFLEILSFCSEHVSLEMIVVQIFVCTSISAILNYRSLLCCCFVSGGILLFFLYIKKDYDSIFCDDTNVIHFARSLKELDNPWFSAEYLKHYSFMSRDSETLCEMLYFHNSVSQHTIRTVYNGVTHWIFF